MSAKTLEGPSLVDERLVVALSHDVREHALKVFSERPASTKEVADELRRSISAVWYHVNRLRELNAIEEVKVEQRRGAHERFYVATADFFFDAEAWAKVPKKNRLAITMRILRLISSDLNEALRAGTVDATDHHISRTLIDLDEDGWEETNDLLKNTLDELLAIRKKNSQRLSKSGKPGTHASVSIMQFELPSRAEP